MDLGPARLLMEQLRTQQLEALDSLRFVFPSQALPPVEGARPAPETEAPWATVIGVGSGLVLATALALSLKKKPSTPAPVALQSPPATLSVAVWKVDPVSKAYRPATDALIEVPPLAQVPQLSPSPNPSPGKVVYQLQLTGPCSCSEDSLIVSAHAGGSLHRARVRLSFAPSYTLEFF